MAVSRRRLRGAVTALVAVAVVLFVASGLARVRRPAPVPFRATREVLTTYHYGNARRGVDLLDPSFRHLRRAWSTGPGEIEGAVYAEPLLYGGEVLVATEEDLVYALRADSGAVLWKLRLGIPASTGSVRAAPGLRGCGDIFPLGVTGTPVISARLGVMFVAAEVQRPGTSGWRGIEHVLVAVRLADHELLWRRAIDPPGASEGSGGGYLVAAEQQRSALTLSHGRVVVELGGLAGDCSAYHGQVISVPERGRGPLEYYITPSRREDAIWATSGAAANRAGDLYVATGNGSVADRRFEMNDAVIELSPSLRVLGEFAPADWHERDLHDLDLGSAGPVLLPGDRVVFETGKPGFGPGGVLESWGYLLDASRLGGVGRPLYRGEACPGASPVFGSDALDRVRTGRSSRLLVVVPCASGLVALEVRSGRRPSFRRRWVVNGAAGADPNGPPIIAGGLVWSISTGADGGHGPASVLYGIEPSSGRIVVEKQLLPVTHFATPAAGDGEIVVAGLEGVEAFRP